MGNHSLQYAAFMLGFATAITPAAADDSIIFNRDILPVLSQTCFRCHGPNEEDRKEDLRLDVPDGEHGALTPRKDYYIIKPGDPEQSELWWRITAKHDDERMPPLESHKQPLTETEIALFKQWIIEGAKYQKFWAFIPPQHSSPATINNKAWAKDPIDHHVMIQFENKGLQPKREADKHTLIRRVTFDLTGLPPAIEEIDAFLSDDSPQAYEKLVDRLFSQTTYGEHMTRYWADLVRLGDTNGMHKDYHRDFSTYRDWLIRSFNNNLPFDEFIKFQLAGDLYEEPSREQLIASGFNRLHLIIDKGTALPEESHHKNIVDQIEAFGTTFLGLTVHCAQCHNHKYDPLTQREYYQLYAFFNNFNGAPETVSRPERGQQKPFINLTTPKQDQRLAGFDAREQTLNMDLSAVEQRQRLSELWPKTFEEVSVPWIWDDPELASNVVEFKTTLGFEQQPDAAIARFVGISKSEVSVNGTLLGKTDSLKHAIVADLSELLTIGDNVITAKATGNVGFAFILEYTVDNDVKTFTSNSSWKAKGNKGSSWEAAHQVHDPDHENGWTTEVRSKEVRQLLTQIASLQTKRKLFLNSVPAAMIMSELDPPRQATMLIGGAYDAPSEPVDRNTPAFLPAMQKKASRYSRMDLADWLVAPNHSLTARVAANRFWQHIFGVGLVKTSKDFGTQGEWPSHPELLDYLAVRFIESGWNVKQLLRTFVLSNTYKQSSDAKPEEYKKDPENRMLSRGSRYRMDAEMIRDQILAVSGQLNRKMYGKSVKPPQPPGLWEMVSMSAPFTYVADTDDKIYRRSLYTYWRRGMPPPQMTIMNAPSREFCVARRERTNTPLQALLLMNEKEYFKAAKATAKILLNETQDVKTGLRRIYKQITSHQPEAKRLELMEKTLGEFRNLYKTDQGLTKSLTPDLSDSDFNERVELAAWTMITHSLFNLDLAKVKR